jgi:Mechanosensitive ion channel
VLFLIFGCIATYSLAGKSRELLKPKAGTSHSAVVGYAILIVGAFATLVITLELFSVPIGQLVLGGALTSVFVGIAAQQALGNVFAGLVLQFARPFHVGDAVRLRAGALGGTLAGVVIDIGITYVRFETGGSVMSVPNSQVLNAVVGPIPPEAEEQPSPAVIADSGPGGPGGPEQSQPRPPGPTLGASARRVVTKGEGPTAEKRIVSPHADPSLRWPVRRSPLGERRIAAPAKRYSAKAINEARGTQPHRPVSY